MAIECVCRRINTTQLEAALQANIADYRILFKSGKTYPELAVLTKVLERIGGDAICAKCLLPDLTTQAKVRACLER